MLRGLRGPTNLVDTRTQRPHRHWDRTVFECLLWRSRSAVDCCRGGALGAVDLGLALWWVNGNFLQEGFSSVQFSRSVLSDYLPPHELQHATPPCPLPTPGVHSDSCPLSQWCHPASSSSVVPFSSCPQSLPASEFSNESTLRMRWPKYWSLALASFLPKNTQGWSPSEWTGWISAVQGTLKSLFQHHSSKASILRHSAFFTVQLSHPYMTTGKNIALTRQTFVGKVMSLLLNMLSRLVITFLPRSKRLLISWLRGSQQIVGNSRWKC